jgi:hypothetical protein
MIRFIMIMPSWSSMILPGETGGGLSAALLDWLVPRRMMRFGNPGHGHQAMACMHRCAAAARQTTWWLFAYTASSSIISDLPPKRQTLVKERRSRREKGERKVDGESWILRLRSPLCAIMRELPACRPPVRVALSVVLRRALRRANTGTQSRMLSPLVPAMAL